MHAQPQENIHQKTKQNKKQIKRNKWKISNKKKKCQNKLKRQKLYEATILSSCVGQWFLHVEAALKYG